MTKIKLTLARNTSQSTREAVILKVLRELGAKATAIGEDAILVDPNDERRVVEILNNAHVNYERAELR